MLDKLHSLLGNQKLLQVVNAVEIIAVHVAELSAPDQVQAIEAVQAFLDKHKKDLGAV